MVSSAGTRAADGEPAHPYTVRLLRAHGDDADGWTSTRLDLEQVTNADLVLTATTQHRHHVVRLCPSAVGRVFPLLQLADYCAGPAGGLPAAAASPEVESWLPQARLALAPSPARADLPDPIGRSNRTFRRVDAIIERAADDLLGLHAEADPRGVQRAGRASS